MRFALIIILAVSSSGCLMETLTVTAIQGELAAQNASSANRVLSHAKDSAARTELQSAIQAFTVENERYPYTLDELKPGYLPEIPMQTNGQPFGYDATSGELVSPPAAGGNMQMGVMTASDRRNVESIRDAIYSYWESTGYYPESLSDLAPLYMTNVPFTSSGTPFIYNRTTGGVNHPAELAAFQRNQARPTGAAAPRGTGYNPSAISGQHTQRQLKAMKDLGL